MPTTLPPTVVVDTGPIVALFDRSEARHDWARRQFDTLRAPLLTCEAVLSETSFILQRLGADPSLPVQLVEQGMLRIAALFDATADAMAVSRLMRRYADVPMSFADACLVRIVESTEHASVMTLDSDFHIYRQRGRRIIPLLTPAEF